MFEDQTVAKQLLGIVLNTLIGAQQDEDLSEDEEEWLSDFQELLDLIPVP